MDVLLAVFSAAQEPGYEYYEAHRCEVCKASVKRKLARGDRDERKYEEAMKGLTTYVELVGRLEVRVTRRGRVNAEDEWDGDEEELGELEEDEW